ncbi:MAG: MCP four helix bundle domain-containing protein, partial [Anaerobiospirillum sp.]|nr:MCP four helix bundle domain-containing protein [Anaerobiospirillum sp.]
MKFFYDLSTKTKLLVCFTIVIAINLIISITTLTSLNQVNKTAEEIDGVLNAAFMRTFTVQEALENAQFNFSTGLNMLYFDYDEKMLERDAPQLIADIKARANALNPDFLGTQEYREVCLGVKQAALNSVKILEERVMPKIQLDAFSDANTTFTTEVYPELAHAIRACSDLYKLQTQYCLNLTTEASDSTIVLIDSVLTV